MFQQTKNVADKKLLRSTNENFRTILFIGNPYLRLKNTSYNV